MRASDKNFCQCVKNAMAHWFPMARVQQERAAEVTLHHSGDAECLSMTVGRTPGGEWEVCMSPVSVLGAHLRGSCLHLGRGRAFPNAALCTILGTEYATWAFRESEQVECIQLVEGLVWLASRHFAAEVLGDHIADRLSHEFPEARVFRLARTVFMEFERVEGDRVDIQVALPHGEGRASVLFAPVRKFRRVFRRTGDADGGVVVRVDNAQVAGRKQGGFIVCNLQLPGQLDQMLALADGLARVAAHHYRDSRATWRRVVGGA